MKNNESEKIHDTRKFLLNLTYCDWLNLLTGKTTFDKLAGQNNVYEKSIDFKIIGNNFGGINEMLSEFLKKQKNILHLLFSIFLIMKDGLWPELQEEEKTKWISWIFKKWLLINSIILFILLTI